jgi:hypothetical protein
MNLEMNRSELERLLEVVFLGEWLLNAHLEPKERSVEHLEAIQKLLALAEENGLGYLIETDEESGEPRPSAALRARIDVAGYIQDYDDCVFWDELALHLAERDLAAEIGKESFKLLPNHERHERVEKLAQQWDAEFDAHGVERLQLPVGTPRARARRDRLTERLKRLFDESAK